MNKNFSDSIAVGLITIMLIGIVTIIAHNAYLQRLERGEDIPWYIRLGNAGYYIFTFLAIASLILLIVRDDRYIYNRIK